MMLPVTDINQYNELLYYAEKKTAAKNIKLIKNCYMLPSEIEYYISQNMLYYNIYGENLAFFCDKDLYYRFYFCFKTTDSDSEFSLPEFDKPLVTEIIGNGDAFSPAVITAEHFLESIGFKLNNFTKRMYMKTDMTPAVFAVDNIKEKQNKEFENIKFIPAKSEMNIADDIYSLWLKTFDPIKNLLPSKRELREDIAAGNIMTAMLNDNTNTLAGVLKAEFLKNTGYIWHEAVSPNMRGQGVGAMLTAGYIEFAAAAKDVFRHYLWVEDGSPAINFHQKFGYQFDGRFSKQYIKT